MKRQNGQTPIRDAKIVKALLQGKTYAEAATEAGYNPAYAARKGREIASRAEPTLREALAKAGLDAEGIAETLKQSAKANKVLYVHPNHVRKAVPDHSARMKAMEAVLDIRGERKAPIQEHQVNVSIEDKRREQERLTSTLSAWGQAIEADVVIEDSPPTGEGVGPTPTAPPGEAEETLDSSS
jgi:hypothetical protein